MNPELRRNLWLELSVHRLLATPAIIGLVSLLILAGGDCQGRLALATVAGVAGLLLLAAWGSQAAADGVADEVRNRTWDAQRLTSVGPWQMTCGKLLGATAFAWYGGGLCLLVFVLAGLGQLPAPVLKLTALIVAGSVFCHAVAFNGALMAARRGPSQRNTSGLVWLGVMMLALGPARGYLAGSPAPIIWWGASYPAQDFALASAVAFAAWAVLGAYRSVCSALHVPTTPWALLVFLAFLGLYVAGLVPASFGSGASRVAMAGAGVSLAASYGLMFVEPADAVTVRRLLMRARRRQWREALQELPGWPLALVLALLCVIGVWLMPAMDRYPWPLAQAGFVIWLFAARDAALLHWFAFARHPRRVVATTVIYLALLYGLLPWLLSVLGADALAATLRPSPGGLNTAAAAMQASVAVALAVWRWRRL